MKIVKLAKAVKNRRFPKTMPEIPSLTFYSEYFRCPRCGWTTPGPRLVKGDIAESPCQQCGHSYLVRIR